MEYGYIAIAVIIAVLAVHSISMARFSNSKDTAYEVVSIEYTSLGKRCAIKNMVNGSIILCEWNQFKDIHVGDILVCTDKKLEKLSH